MRSSQAYLHDVGILKIFNNQLFRLTHCKAIRNSDLPKKQIKFVRKGEGGYVDKLDCSISRTKSRIRELALCNPWEYFVTFTLDAKKYDRYNLPTYIKDLGVYIKNYNRLHNCKIKYILIPEQHEDGAWHLHGFFLGLQNEFLIQFTKDMHLPYQILKKLEKGHAVFSWDAYSKRFGWCTLEPIRNSESTASYITKYITKDVAQSVTELNAHMYYCSKGLQRAEILERRQMLKNIQNPTFSNDYVTIKDFHNKDEAINYFYEVSYG